MLDCPEYGIQIMMIYSQPFIKNMWTPFGCSYMHDSCNIQYKMIQINRVFKVMSDAESGKSS